MSSPTRAIVARRHRDGFRLGERQFESSEVVGSRLAPTHRYFKVRDTQGDLYIFLNDVPIAGS